VSSVENTVREFGAPVLAVCGFSGSGKTTLLEAVIPRLVSRGLAVAVVKHDAHGFDVDRPGKDSDRFFRAGATVTLRGPGQQFERRANASLSLEATLARLAADHDLLLVEGHKDTALPKFWLASPGRSEAPEDVGNIVGTMPWNSDRLAKFMEYIDSWLPLAWKSRPLYGGLLIGGRSLRMGEPKQLLRFAGQTLGEIASAALGLVCEKTVALGPGPLPEALRKLPQLPDAPGFGGPGAGLIAAHRWAPQAAWIVAACDHPWLRVDHIAWLASQRQPGRWAIIPRQSDGHPCPTLALYEPQALEALDRQARADGEHNPRMWALLPLPSTLSPQPPPALACGWTNVNTPEELRTEEQRPKEPTRR
jgi:molybdopterin-guanine dinucleotide biosynthesis protein MobB